MMQPPPPLRISRDAATAVADPHERRSHRRRGSPWTTQTPPNRAGHGRVALIGGARAGRALFGGRTQDHRHGYERTHLWNPLHAIGRIDCLSGREEWDLGPLVLEDASGHGRPELLFLFGERMEALG